MQRPRRNRQPFTITPWRSLDLGEQVVHLLLLMFALGALGYTLFKPMAAKAQRIQAREPAAENRPTWVRALELFQLIPPYSELDRRPNEPVQTGPPAPLPRPEAARRAGAEDARSRREPPVRAPSAEVSTHPLAQALTRAAEEASLPEVEVLGVDCAEGREGFCIAWGQGTSADADVHALMRAPSFREHRGSVAEWAVSAVHWGSDWTGEPAFFALGIHERKNDGDLRKAFATRSRVLRVAHEAGGDADERLAADPEFAP